MPFSNYKLAPLLVLISTVRLCCCSETAELNLTSHFSCSQNSQSGVSQEICATSDDCPPWMTCTNKSCHCSKQDFFNGVLKCEERGISVLGCYCFTYDKKTAHFMVGACVENCMNVTKQLYDFGYHPTFNSADNVNEIMCGRRFNRDGRLCGNCLPGFRPQAYSFNMTCVNCTEGNRNLWKYFFISFVPLTCFYFVVLFFKVNTTSSHLHGYVLFAQAISVPTFARIISLALERKPNFVVPAYIVFSLYGVWNLDFFRMLNLGLCLDMTPLSVRALDYMIAVYPLFLTVISYILINLHDRNYKIIVILWKPFRCIFTVFRRKWDIRTSVIDAYATFYQLSLFKVLCITFDMLTPTYVYTVGEEAGLPRLVLYYDGTLDYFGPEHLPYAIPAMVFALLFVVCPLFILLFYQCRCIQPLLGHYLIHSFILHTFMDSFQSCYKNGTEPGTHDCRWFAAFDVLVRIFIYLVFSFTLGSLFFPLATVVIVFVILFISIVQPYRKRVAHFNKIDVSFYCFLALLYSSITSNNIASIKAHYFVNACYILSLLVTITPLIYISCICIHWIFSRRSWGRTFINHVRAWRRGYDLLEESLPDRLVNPDQYSRQDTTALNTSSDDERGAGNLYTY